MTDTATFSGTNGAVTGTATFFICTPAQVTGAGCPAGSGTQVGGAVTIAAGSATSAAYTVGQTSAAVGKYCWRAEYTPDAASQYLAGTHTNATVGTNGECFTVAPATIDIDKVANPAGPVNAGDPIGFDITVTNTGTGTALGVSVSDNLPTGVDWTLGTVSGGASCQITGAVGAEVLTCTKASLAVGCQLQRPRHGSDRRVRLRHDQQHGQRQHDQRRDRHRSRLRRRQLPGRQRRQDAQ